MKHGPRLRNIILNVLALTVLGLFPSQGFAAGLDFSTLPLPAGTKKVFLDANTAIYSIGTPPGATAEACEKLLLNQGWVPYGFSGDTRYYKRGNTRLLANVQAAFGKDKGSMISFTSEPLSADIPLPPGTEDVQYNNSAKRLGFLTTLAPEGVADFYRKALAPAGWSTTMETPDKSDFIHVFILRSPKDEMIRIEMTPTSGKLRTVATYQTAEEVATERQRVATGMASLREKLANEASAPKPAVTLTLPPDTISKALTTKELKMNLPANKAKATVQSLCKNLVASGWKELPASLETVGGSVQLTQENRTLHIVYIDPGFMPAEVTVTPVGVEIKIAE